MERKRLLQPSLFKQYGRARNLLLNKKSFIFHGSA